MRMNLFITENDLIHSCSTNSVHRPIRSHRMQVDTGHSESGVDSCGGRRRRDRRTNDAVSRQSRPLHRRTRPPDMPLCSSSHGTSRRRLMRLSAPRSRRRQAARGPTDPLRPQRILLTSVNAPNMSGSTPRNPRTGTSSRLTYRRPEPLTCAGQDTPAIACRRLSIMIPYRAAVVLRSRFRASVAPTCSAAPHMGQGPAPRLSLQLVRRAPCSAPCIDVRPTNQGRRRPSTLPGKRRLPALQVVHQGNGAPRPLSPPDKRAPNCRPRPDAIPADISAQAEPVNTSRQIPLARVRRP